MTDLIARLMIKGLLPLPIDPTPQKIEAAPKPEQILRTRAEAERILSREDVDAIDIEISEKCIEQSAHAAGPYSNFQALRDAAEVFRKADLTPVYFTNKGQTAIRVVPREYLNNPHMLN